MSSNVAILIPAYKPSSQLAALAGSLARELGAPVLVVNDGSPSEYDRYFELCAETPGVEVISHVVNLGKGQALKTGLNHLYARYGHGLVGVVTADADGQHLVHDIAAVADTLRADPSSLVLGARRFEGDVPLRSRLGNQVTRVIFRFVAGWWAMDTQTGLRGIPACLVPDLLRLKSTRYEFELDMLIAARKKGLSLKEVPIQTVYIDGNRSSHFNPLVDSLRVYFVFARFMGASMVTALSDYLVFIAATAGGVGILGATAWARAFATAVNFFLVRRYVFKSRSSAAMEFAKFAALVVVLGYFSYRLTSLLAAAGFPVLLAKCVSELGLYALNFTVQRRLVFAVAGRPAGALATEQASPQ